jgi:hypothetical protein
LNNAVPVVAAVGTVADQFADQIAISVPSVTESRVSPGRTEITAPAAFVYEPAEIAYLAAIQSSLSVFIEPCHMKLI